MKNRSQTNSSILQDGRIKPGIYKIKNLESQTYVDVKDNVRELCGRPTSTLEDSRDQWEILPLGPGYTIRKAGTTASRQPDQFCVMLMGVGNGTAVSVSEFPVAWKIAVVDDDPKHNGYEYVRIIWGPTNMVWDLAQWGSAVDGTRVQVMDNRTSVACRIWELVPVQVDGFAPQPSSSFGTQRNSTAVPPYEERTGNHCCACSHLATEPGDDGYGTTVIETTITRKKYRVED